MTPEQREALARTRFAMIAALRASGVVLMLFGLWIWHGSLLRAGGWAAVGAPLFLLGFVQSLLLPQWLARRWRSGPPR